MNRLLPLLVPGLVVTAMAWLRLGGDVPPPPLLDLDVREYFVPNLELVRASLLSGSLPLWTSQRLAGYPFAATMQTGVYYPLLTPLLALPVPVAISVHLLVHLWLAGALAMGLGRRFGLDTTASCATAVTFMLSGPVVSTIYNPAMLSTVVWLPAILTAIHRLSERSDARGVAFLSIATSLAFLGGHPQLFLYETIAATTFAGFLLLSPRSETRLRYTAGLLSAAFLTALLVAVQAWPTFELVSLASRDSTALAPDVLRPARIDQGPGAWMDGEATGLPLAMLPLAGVAVLLGRGRTWILSLFFSALLLFSIDAMRGSEGFTFRIWSLIPLATTFRFPERFALLGAISGAVLVGLGLHATSTRLARAASSRLIVRPAAAAILAVLFLEVWTDNAPQFQYRPLVSPESLSRDPGMVSSERERERERETLELAIRGISSKTSTRAPRTRVRVSRPMASRFSTPMSHCFRGLTLSFSRSRRENSGPAS